MLKVIERATGKVVGEWNMKNVKSYCEPEGVAEMRKRKDHELFSFMIEFVGLDYDLGMYEVDKFDLVLE